MNEFEFIAITLLLVILVVITVDWIITKYRRQKTLIPKEDFDGQLNDLDKIIEGVSTDGTKQETTNETTNNDKIEEDTSQKNNDEKEDDKEKTTSNSDKSSKKSSTSLKNAMITKEILTPKHSDKK